VFSLLTMLMQAHGTGEVKYPAPTMDWITIFVFTAQPPYRGSDPHILMTLPHQPGKPKMTA